MAEINVGQISEALNNKADLDLNNTQPLADYVIETQAPTSINNYTWYRLYKSGWCEQGGISGNVSNSSVNINLIKNYVDTNYSLVTTAKYDGTSVAYDSHVGNMTTSSFTIYSKETASHTVFWEAKGFAAQS